MTVIGERLADIRKDHGETQADLAARLNVSVSAVRSWEQEKSSPSHDLLISICRMYQVSADFLLGLSDADPALELRRRGSRFEKDDLAELRSFEEYLLWKKRRQAQHAPADPGAESK